MPILKGLLRQHRLGQSLTEYSLGIALVALLVTPAIIMFGGQLNQAWQGFGGGLKPVKGGTNPNGVTDLSLRQAVNRTVQFQTAKGNTITLNSALSNPLDKNITTLGANGTTAMLADSLSSMAKQMLDSGDISKDQYGTLIELSNKGHRMAQVENVIEQAAKDMPAGTDKTVFTDTKVVLNGQTSSIFDIWTTLSYSTPGGGLRYIPETDTDITTLPADVLHPQDSDVTGPLAAFLDVYHQAESSGALSDPAVAQVVSTLSTQIALTNASVDQALGAVYLGHSSAGEFQSIEASQATHMNSAGICTAGKGSDSGVSCNP